MKYSAIFSHASRLRESGNRFILAELEKVGLSDIAPSHGDILVRLLACEACNMSELAKQVHRTKSTVTALVEKLGRDIPMAATYRLLARHGWRKVQPDTKHPKGDPAAQEEFKKNSRKRWLPPA